MQHAKDTINRDVKLNNFLNGDISGHFSSIKRFKSSKSHSNIQKLTVGDKVYTGEAVCDGFFDSISSLKKLDLQSLEDSPTFSKYS